MLLSCENGYFTTFKLLYFEQKVTFRVDMVWLICNNDDYKAIKIVFPKAWLFTWSLSTAIFLRIITYFIYKQF